MPWYVGNFFRSTNMNYRLIFLLSLSGVVMGLLSVYVVPTRLEAAAWLPIFLLCSVVLARYTTKGHFKSGLMVGLISGLLTTLIQFMLVDVYLLHHQPEAIYFAKIAKERGVHAGPVILMMGSFMSLVSAIVMGAFSFAGYKIFNIIQNS